MTEDDHVDNPLSERDLPDSELMLTRILDAASQDTMSFRAPDGLDAPARGRPVFWAVAAGLLVVALGAIGWLVLQPQTTDVEPAGRSNSPPAATTSPARPTITPDGSALPPAPGPAPTRAARPAAPRRTPTLTPSASSRPTPSPAPTPSASSRPTPSPTPTPTPDATPTASPAAPEVPSISVRAVNNSTASASAWR